MAVVVTVGRAWFARKAIELDFLVLERMLKRQTNVPGKIVYLQIVRSHEQLPASANPGIVVLVVLIQQRACKAVEIIVSGLIVRWGSAILPGPELLEAGEFAYRQGFYSRILNCGDYRTLPFIDQFIGEMLPRVNDVRCSMSGSCTIDFQTREVHDAIQYEIVIIIGQMDEGFLDERLACFAIFEIVTNRLDDEIAAP